MPNYLLFPAKHRRLRNESSNSLVQEHIPLSQTCHRAPVALPPIIRDNGNRRTNNRWRFLCYFLHGFLPVPYLTLLVVAMCHHPEHQITVPDGPNIMWTTTELSVGLQTFYTLYATLLVFVTQKLMLSAVFSSPKKLTQVHDICGAWAGFGAALSALWQQTKAAPSVLSILLVTMYFTCISMLHVTSSTLVQFQSTNIPTTASFFLQRPWPNTSIDLLSLDWMAMTPLIPFLQNFYPNETLGLGNSTLYDTPYKGYPDHAMTLDANCGVLTNLSVDTLEDNTWNISASMWGLDPINITVPYPPLLNEIWFSPSIECLEPICSTFILFLISTEIEVDDSISGVNQVYINRTYYSPSGATQNFSSPIRFVACTLNATNHMITLDSSGYPLSAGKQPDATWSAFSPAGDQNLTRAMSYAMKSANSLPPSLYCQPIMSNEPLWANITIFNAYMISALGMDASLCFGTPLAQYGSSASPLTRSQLENTVSQVAAGLIWLAGELGVAGGGFDRQDIEYQLPTTVTAYRLNINILPVVIALCTSVILLILVLYTLWRCPLTVVPGTGILEIMWFGSRSQVLRDHLADVQSPSLNVLRPSAMFEITFGAGNKAHRGEESTSLPIVAPSSDQEVHSRSTISLGLAGSRVLHISDASQNRSPHKLNVSRATRHWCYALHVVLVGLHVTLLTFLAHHPEQSIIIPEETSTMTIGLSAILQAIYTLYSALLVLLMQRLALFEIVTEPRKLTTVHDVSRAWTGVGAATHVLWQQRKRSSSTREIIPVGVYLAMMLVLHITSSSIMQWQMSPLQSVMLANSPPVDVTLQTSIALPDSTVNVSQLGWTGIFPIISLLEDGMYTFGLSRGILSDVPLNDIGINVTGLLNATTLNTQCGLVSNLSLSYQNAEEGYQISFQNGTSSGSFLERPIWRDAVHSISPSTECMACPQTVFYLITTAIDVDESVSDPVVVGLNWSYTPSAGGDPQTSITLTYIAACSLSTQTVSATVEQISIFQDQTPTYPTTSWSVWSQENATNLNVGMSTTLSKGVTTSFPVFFQGNFSANFTDMDNYIMSLLNLNLTHENETSISQSSANPSTTLRPWQLENAITQTAAKLLWTAGQVGKSGGGFQRATGEVQGLYYPPELMPMCLHVNTIPVVFASIASFVSLIMAIIIIGKGPSRREHPMSVSGTSVLECLWMEANSKLLHSRLKTVEEPSTDALRAAGMFEICLGDVGCSSYTEAEQPMLELADE